ncbi:MAG: lipocalin-like domain-containing protein [Granulosicoccus sp.]
MSNPSSSARRCFLQTATPMALLCFTGSRTALADEEESLYPVIPPDPDLSFPRDHGAHPAYRTEWWYLTAWFESENGPMGMQITFFRSRTPYGRDNPSRFAPEQLVLAHAALSMPVKGTLMHDEQAWRADDTIARFSVSDTDVEVGLPASRWRMFRDESDQYQITVNAREFAFSITARPPPWMKAPVLQGKAGFSQKGPAIEQSSCYYSRPQLQIEGFFRTDGSDVPVKGNGWLDHEWSSSILDEQATGWDWVGLNFHDGSALMAFQVRRESGEPLYSAARLVENADSEMTQKDLEPRFTPLRYWQSARTDARYPVSARLVAGDLDLLIEPLFDDQELDSRASTGVIYWEGAVQVWDMASVQPDGSKTGERIATGYMELTGYAGTLSL